MDALLHQKSTPPLKKIETIELLKNYTFTFLLKLQPKLDQNYVIKILVKGVGLVVEIF